ncbi:MAG: hypothetical protein P4L36_15805 [Holophaga sp.]|nr:hypothetical protein [Holophaga sp.]
MNHKITLHLPQTPARLPAGAARSNRLLMLVLAGWTLVGTGCFRATGIQRSPMVAEVLPETGGDAVLGLKQKAGAGDFYLGNDFIQVAIDSTVYGDTTRTPLAGATSGGSIVDAGYILLDSSYTRVSIPGNAMNRLTPVVNQDKNMETVFDSYSTSKTADTCTITMTGRILDPNNTLGTGTSPAAGVAVTHKLSITQLQRYITMSTTVTNNTSGPLPIINIGDHLIQQGGGYAFNVPANYDYQGNALATPSDGRPTWGVQIPNTVDWSSPVSTSVQASMVGLIDTEIGADTLDSHCSLGILPVDADQLLVASDPQDLLTITKHIKPTFPENLVVGSLPAATSLGAGQSLTYNRRLFIVGGTSVATNIVTGLSISVDYPDQGNGLFNLMDTYRYADVSLRPVQDVGTLTFTLSGMSQRQGPLPTEVRIERNVTATTPPANGVLPATWALQRVEYLVPNENLVNTTGLAPSTLLVKLPVGVYRMVLLDQTKVQTRTLFENTNVVTSPDGSNQVGLTGPLWIQKDQNFVVSGQDVLSPDAANDTAGNPNLTGAITSNSYSVHYFLTREANSPAGNLQPLRMTFVGTNGTANPVMPRMRTVATYYDATNKVPQVANGSIPGQYQFRGGNEMFGTGFTRLASTQFAWFANGGSYTAYGTRGPLSDLQSLDFQASDVQTNINHVFTILPWGLPPNWTSFDLPGPSQATTGGYLPAEKAASAMANGVQVVGHTEQDRLVDGYHLFSYFRDEFGSVDLTPYQLPASLSNMTRPPEMQFGQDPFVVAGRTSTMTGSDASHSYGTATALFTPTPTNAALGGAQPNNGWTLADFLTQAQGQFNVVHRPRGPAGLFTEQGSPTVTDGSAFSPWWSKSGTLSFGQTNGGFDALELLRGESFDGSSDATATAWLTEFKAVRTDWFNLLNLQSPTFFTKALGLSSATFSADTPVGLARTYLKATPIWGTDLSMVLSALKSGAAVASTGPFLDVNIGTAGPGGLVPGPVQSVTLNIALWKTDWMPVDEIRVVVNGVVVQTLNPALSTLIQSGSDSRRYTGSITLPLSQLVTTGQDAWVVVEAGVPLATSGIYAAGTPWNLTMRGIYPIAVTNPIFVNVKGGGYTAPGLTPLP